MDTHSVDEFWRIQGASGAWNQVLHLGRRKEFKSGEAIIHAGERVDSLCYLQSGEVSMRRTSCDGGEKILFHVGANTVFCETPVFIDQPIRSAFVCHEDAVVYFFTKDVVDRMLAEYPEIAKDIIRTLSEKLSVLSNQSASLGLDSLCQRIVKFILLRYNSLSLPENEVVTFGSLRIKDVASILGVHRVTLYKAFKELEKMRLIRMIDKKSLRVLDVEALIRIAYE
jgi:CRP-like cAMP-binding protein